MARRTSAWVSGSFRSVQHMEVAVLMTERETQLEAALVSNAAIRVQAEQLIAAHVAPESRIAFLVHDDHGA
jgi:hypothetical protein